MSDGPKERVDDGGGPAAGAGAATKDPDTDAPRGGRRPPPGDVTMKRSAYHGLVVTAVVGIAAGAFFAGYLAASSTGQAEYVTQSQLQGLLAAQQQQQNQQLQGLLAAQQQQRQQPAPIPSPSGLIVDADDDPVIGDPDAPVTIVEFSDFECPFCARFYHQTLPLLKQDYIDTGVVKMVYRDFPIDSIHPNARLAHIAAECADEQGMFWPYHDILFERQPEWSGAGAGGAAAAMDAYAEELSLDAGAFGGCLGDPAVGAEIDADVMQGRQYGTTGTPSFYIGNDQSGYTHVGGAKPFESFVRAINEKIGP